MQGFQNSFVNVSLYSVGRDLWETIRSDNWNIVLNSKKIRHFLSFTHVSNVPNTVLPN
jgi:hypothetical protein